MKLFLPHCPELFEIGLVLGLFFPNANQFFSINLFHLKTIWKVLFGIDNLNNLIQIQRFAFYLMGLSMARQYAPCL